jgi:Zn-finger nucleic acid-binding protein
MANCVNCGAPLRSGANVCQYCRTHNDIDLKGIHKHTVEELESDRTCPRCNKPLQTIDLKIEGKFLIEKCPDCFGLFFDPGELEALLEKSVSNVFDINYKQLEDIKNQSRHDDYPVRYIKCPVCGKLMNRINFGAQSGVVLDKCKQDGVWVDGGELKQLMQWVKAGGQLMHHKTRMEQERLELEREKRKIRESGKLPGGSIMSPIPAYSGGSRGVFNEDPDLLGLVTRFVSKILS